MKLILIDNSVILNRAILSWSAQQKMKQEGRIKKDSFILPSHYTYFQILIGVLKRIGVDKDDKVYLIIDGRNSFRRAFYPIYKANRKEKRDQNQFVNWEEHWQKINEIVGKIDQATNFNIVFVNKIWSWVDLLMTNEGQKLIDENNIVDYDEKFSPEADDVIATICLNNKQTECIIVSIDADLQQLLVLPNVKYFTLMQKYQNKRGMYKVGINGYKILESKIKKGDKGDNILISSFETEIDKEIRKFCVDLINLPQWVQDPILENIKMLSKKEENLELLPFPSSLGKKFVDIYKKTDILTYEKCVKLEEKKKKK